MSLAHANSHPPGPVAAPARTQTRRHRRGWVVRRMLVAADAAGLALALFVAGWAIDGSLADWRAWAGLAAALPLWILAARLHGLYDGDEDRADHSTVDDVPGVFHLVTAGAWLALLGTRATGSSSPGVGALAVFWALAVPLVITARACARAGVRHSAAFVQRAIIVGAGDVGQLVARKALQHPEYGIDVVGFVDDEPRSRRTEAAGIPLLGRIEELPEAVARADADRVVVAFSRRAERDTVDLVRALRHMDVHVDVVPRLYEVVGPRIANHTIETLPLLGLPPARPARSSRFIKRLMDLVGASVALVLVAPLMLVIAVLVRRSSEGPALFRQERLGLGMRPFTALKFRTMRVGTDDSAHREYIRQTMSADAAVGGNGIYKLDRGAEVTGIGRWLRRTSLDELPQLINVLRGEMSLVGPRPCIAYETEHFKPHHFERFLVPPGITGLWQVAARAHATFGESLDMDVAYARGWSLGLDLRLLCQTPVHLIRVRGTA